MRTTSAPLVSVCVPVHNCAAYIGRAIESVLTQTLPDWELIILDNASSDETLRIVRSYSDPRIRIVEQDHNVGIEANWNRALDEARGMYVKLLPADDYMLPECLEKQTAAFRLPGNEGVVLTCCGRSIVGPSGKGLITRRFKSSDGRLDGHAAIRRVVRSGTNLLGEPGAILFRRDVLTEVGHFTASLLYVIDVELWLRILLRGDLYTIAEPLCAFRLSSGSYSVELAALHSRHFSTFIRKLSADRRYQVSRTDAYQGVFMSRVLASARRLVYLLTVRGTAGAGDGKAR